jgi:hypothetical protein
MRGVRDTQRQAVMFGPALVISPGAVFATDHEDGCVAETSPDQYGNFDALNSHGVLCRFWTGAVRGHCNYRRRS